MVDVETYIRWLREHNCDHVHCKYLCEHPQPFFHLGKLVCGRCFFVTGEVTEMIPCTPEVCD